MDESITSPLPPLENDITPELTKPALVQFETGFTLSATAQQNLSMSKAGGFLVRAENNLEMINSGAGVIVSGKDLIVKNGGAGAIVSGGDFTLENGGAQTIVVGGDMEITNGGATLVIPGGDLTVKKSIVGVALAKEVNVSEDSRVVLDTPRALIFGAAFGGVFALVRWLLKR
jgi:hypothetical protein